MLEYLILDSLVVFAITLIVVKSSVMAAKRDFVISRFKQSQKGVLHYWWYSMHTCCMCLGFWASIVVAWVDKQHYPFISGMFALFAINWLLHCVESALFNNKNVN